MTVGALRDRRASGVLLHPTSFPGAGVGSVGREAIRFVDWLADAGQSAWQILPLVATDEGGSPYNGLSAFAGNPLLIDLHDLVEDGLLPPLELEAGEVDSPAGGVDFPRVSRWKQDLLARAFAAFRGGAAPGLEGAFEEFLRRNSYWLEDYTLFRVLRGRFEGAAWTRWDPALRDREPGALQRFRVEHADALEGHAFAQFLFDRQWRRVRAHAGRRGVSIIGDVPIFVAHDSADVWANRELFALDERGEPTVVSGVPPDYFSETGQRWGNPLYRWDELARTDYRWWVQRFRCTFEQVDVVRVDHFRGFAAYWEVPAEEETALHGRWVTGPGRALFDAIARTIGPLPVIAEDLGLITPDVEALRDALGFPGMRVLQFAFDGDRDNPHLPENYVPNAVAYTGTHDNDTIVGWWEGLEEEERRRVGSRIPADEDPLQWRLMRLVARSGANLAIYPAQDLLGLGSEARMNTPGTRGANWSWRLSGSEFLDAEIATRLRELTRESGRLAADFAAKDTP